MQIILKFDYYFAQYMDRRTKKLFEGAPDIECRECRMCKIVSCRFRLSDNVMLKTKIYFFL
jgi:hypothetical protein